jgi:hypothetical protein
MQPTLQTVFRQHYEPFASKRKLPLHQLKAASSILGCRTEQFGGHLQYCPHGHFDRFWYHSCSHRSCPQCGQLGAKSWLQAQKELLLRCDHYHVVFTFASELNVLWTANTRAMAGLLFKSARDTLIKLLADKKFLGALPGMIGNLHTWGRPLPLHPHTHFIVTGGGIDAEGRWRSSKNGYLLPFRVVRKVFRAKYLSGLWKLVERGELVPPEKWTLGMVKKLLHKVAKGPKWNVHLCSKYSHGNGVVTYLARYLRSGAISNRQILACDESSVTFAYTSHEDGKAHTMTLSGSEFVRRVLSHVPESGFHIVRYYGLYAKNKRDVLNKIRVQLGQPPAKPRTRLTAAAFWALQRVENPLKCPICNCDLVDRRIVVRGGAPPPLLGLLNAN